MHQRDAGRLVAPPAIEKPRLSGASSHFKRRVQAVAGAFRILRRPSRPNTPAPAAKSGRVAGSGTAVIERPEICPPLLPVPPLTIRKKSDVPRSVKVASVIVLKPFPKLTLLPS